MTADVHLDAVSHRFGAFTADASMAVVLAAKEG